MKQIKKKIFYILRLVKNIQLILLLTFLNLLPNENPFVFIIPSYNNAQWYKKNLDSIFCQKYKNYRAIYIDDCSSDNTGKLVEQYIKENNQEKNFTLIKNKERKFALENIYNAIHTCKPNEIVVCLDGDDWIANGNVLTYLNNVYQDKNIWLTYGQYLDYPTNAMGGCRQIPNHIIEQNSFRKYDWVTSHIRTFYAGLFHKIKKEDLLNKNKFYEVAGDVALMYPLLEMAGNHIKFIPEVLYIYNIQNPLNDNKVNKELQCKLFTHIRNLKPYEKLDNLNIANNDKKFVIVVPSYNNSQWYKQNLDSIFSQNYGKYRVIYIDDCSNDKTYELVEKYIKENHQESKVTLIKNEKRQLALSNIYKAVISCKDDEIIVLVDGDDQLASHNVLKLLNAAYKKFDIWMTHGNYKTLSNNAPCSYCPVAPPNIVKENKFREFPHGLIHLRTFYAWLFKQIKIQDLFFRTNFFKMTYDVAIFTPMIEMANDRHLYIPTLLYIYNDINSISDHKVNMKLQHFINKYIRQKDKYTRLLKSQENFLDKYNDAKVDLIINDINQDKLGKILKFIANNSEFINYVFVNKAPIDICTQESKFFSINEYNNLIDKTSDYTMFLSDEMLNEKKINIIEIIKEMELTKAFAAFITNSENLNECKKISNNLFIKYIENKKFESSLAIFRKKDISLTNFQWQNLAINKICIFKKIYEAN